MQEELINENEQMKKQIAQESEHPKQNGQQNTQQTSTELRRISREI